jgi:carbon-monoxide dehydrogenase medium subunit
VKPAPFAYADPRSIDEALDLLARHGDDAKILSGALTADDRTLAVGALVRQRQLERWAPERAPLLAAALALVGHAAIRNRGTVAGSVAHADPAAELPALLLALDGVALARSRRGERRIAAADLFLGPLATSLAPDELLVETRWTLPAPGEGWGLREVARRHGDFALVGAVAVAGLRGERIVRPRIAVFGAGPKAVRLTAAERALDGETPAAIPAAAQAAVRDLDAHADIHATAEYRRAVAATLVARALADALGRAGAPAR